MPPQEQNFPPLNKELVDKEKSKQEEIITRAKALQKEQQDRWDKEKKEKEELRESYRLKNSFSHIKPFDPEKDGKDGKSIAGNQGEEN